MDYNSYLSIPRVFTKSWRHTPFSQTAFAASSILNNSVVAECYNIFEVTKKLFADFGHHNLLWPEATTFEKSQG